MRHSKRGESFDWSLEGMRRAAKIDDNQKAIVAALREIGASVTPLHTVGNGCPDALVGFRGRTVLMEFKDGDKPKSQQKLTPMQEKWRSGWKGGPAVTVRSVDEALNVLGVE